MFWCGCIIHHTSVIVEVFTFHILAQNPENCHGMIILWSRYIVGQAMSLSLLASFHVSETYPHRFTTLAGTRCVDWWESYSDRHSLSGCGKNRKTLKNMFVSLVDIYIYLYFFFSFCFALPCSIILKCVNLFITCLNKKITTTKKSNKEMFDLLTQFQFVFSLVCRF